MGRRGKRVVLDLEQLRELRSIMCTDEEIAAVLKTSVDTIKRRIADTPAVAEAYTTGRDEGKASLRRIQYEVAIKGHNVGMLIWLGKQYLSQIDKADVVLDETKIKEIIAQVRDHLKGRKHDGDKPMPPDDGHDQRVADGWSAQNDDEVAGSLDPGN